MSNLLRNWQPELKRRSRRFLSACTLTSLLILSGAAMTQAQDLRLEVEVGKSSFYSFQKQVDRYEQPIAVSPRSIARASFRENRLYVEGLAPGVAKITFKGTYRRLIVGTEIRENPKPFSYEIQVVVSGAQADVQPTIRNYLVSQRSSRTTQLDHFLSSPFGEMSRAAEWSVDPPRSSNGNVASAQWVKNSRGNLAVQITGINAGRTTILLSGQRRINNSWQRVTRSIEVVVAGRDSAGTSDQTQNDVTNAPGGNLPPANAVDALESMFDSNKFQAKHIQSDEDKQRVIEDFNKTEFLAKRMLDTERTKRPPSENAISRLEALLDQLRQARKQLSPEPSAEPSAPKVLPETGEESSLTGTWTLFHRGVKQKDYRIEDDGTYIYIYSGSKLWILIIGRGPIMDCRLPAGSSDDLTFGARMVQLRRGSNPNEFEFWVTPSMYDANHIATGYTLVRKNG